MIDPPTWAFIRATDASYPPDTASLTIADQRAIYDRMPRLIESRQCRSTSITGETRLTAAGNGRDRRSYRRGGLERPRPRRDDGDRAVIHRPGH